MTLSKLSKSRLNILKKIKEDINISKDPNSVLSYPCTWFKNLGYFKVQSNYKNNIINFFLQYLKELFLISNLYSYEIFKHKNLSLKDKKNIYITWCTKSDFKNDGSYIDKYMPKKVKKEDIWFLINVGDLINTNKLRQNNIILYQKKSPKGFSILFFFKILFNSLFQEKYSIFSIGVYKIFSDLINIQINQLLNKGNFKNLIMPYEAQPFQKKLILTIKEKYKKMKVISYLNAIQPFPIHLYNEKIIPDMNYSVSKMQIHQMTNIFKWDKKKIELIKSHKFNKSLFKRYNNKIVLPHYITNKKKVVDLVNIALELKPKNFFSKLEIAPHPIVKSDHKYMKLVNSLESTVKKFEKNFNFSKKKQCFVVGSTSTVFEALELGIEVYHIVEDPKLEAVDNFFWPKIKIKQLNNNIFVYNKVYNKMLINY